MDLRIFEKSPEMAPLMVRLYDSHRLYSLAGDDTPAARMELSNVVAELVEKNPGLHERELVSDVLISLMRQAELDLRTALAERLSLVENAPLRVILHMANDEIAVATPVLKNSPVLSDLDLLYIIKGKTPEYWSAIAKRARISDNVMNILAETREAGTARALAENQCIRLSLRASNVIGTMAETDEALARPLLMRDDLPEDIARHLYDYVGTELRGYIRDYFGVQGDAVSAAIDDVMLEFTGDQKARKFMPTDTMVEAAKTLAHTGQLTMAVMMAPLQRGQFGTFIALFAQFSGLSPHDAHDILSDASGKMLAITCRALRLTKGDLSRIYMMTQRLRSEDRVVDHQELLRAISAFDNISIEKAQAFTHIREH